MEDIGGGFGGLSDTKHKTGTNAGDRLRPRPPREQWLPACNADTVPAHRSQQTRPTRRKNPGMNRSPSQHVRLPPHEAVIMLDRTTRNHLTREGRGAGATPPKQN